MLAATRKSVSAPTARVASTSAAPRPVVCRAQKGEENDAVRKAVALPLAGLVAAALMTSAFVPDEALAARSAGRSGGSSGFQSRRSAPSSAAAPQMRSSTTVVSPSVVVSSPPVFSPFGFGGGYGYGYAPAPIFSPFGIGLGFGFGGFFQIFFLLATVSIVFSVIKGIADAAGRAANKNDKDSQDDDWGKL